MAFGTLKSGGGACFRAAIEHRLLGGSCSVLSDAHVSDRNTINYSTKGVDFLFI